jgi:hypothetical protein
MKVTHILGHNSNWSIESHLQQNIGDYFLIAAYNHGIDFITKKSFQKILDISMIDLQFYGKKSSKGKLAEFPFHPANDDSLEATSVYLENCIKNSITFQIESGFQNIIIPHFYAKDSVRDIIGMIRNINKYVKGLPHDINKYFMTLPFANHIINDSHKVEEILFECTQMNISFDGYFVVCENMPEFRKKVTTDIDVIKNLARVLKTLKSQNFETIYAYANWDAILFLALTDIDYVTIGTYENLRNFDIKRYIEPDSGGNSRGYYFSEKLLNMVKADDITLLRQTGNLDLIRNERNIFSDIILNPGYVWNIHKPDVNKNYLLSIARLLKTISSISDIKERKRFVKKMIDRAMNLYDMLEDRGTYLNKESGNYHLNIWKSFLSIE